MAVQILFEIVLGALFLIAGIAKLVDLNGSRETLTNFGIRDPFLKPLRIVLPGTEVALAVGLSLPVSSHLAAVGIALLSLVFLAVVIYQLAKGRRPNCHCFGQLYSRPIGAWTLARNTIILAAAVWLALRPPLPASPISILWTSLGSLSPRSLNFIVLAIVCTVSLVQTSFLLEVMKQNGRLMLKLEQLPEMPRLATPSASPGPAKKTPPLPIGSIAPEFELPSLTGQTVSLRDLRSAGKSTLLVFSDPSCGPCQAFMPELVNWQSTHQDLLQIALVSRGTVEENQEKAAGLNHVLLQKEREVIQAFRCEGTPGAVLVGAHGKIDSDMAHGSVQIALLVSAFASSRS